MIRDIIRLTTASILAFSLAALYAGCGNGGGGGDTVKPAATELNASVGAPRNDIPKTRVTPNLEAGREYTRESLKPVQLAEGVTAKVVWGKGIMMAWLTLAPNAVIPEEKLPSERLMVVWEGTVDQFMDGTWKPMKAYVHNAVLTDAPHKDFVYMTAGSQSSVKAGPIGATILEIYSPVRVDYIKKAGGKAPKQKSKSYGVSPNFPANTIMDLYDVQFTPFSEDRTANSRMIWGQNLMASFLSVDEGRVSKVHSHPEEQLMMVIGGELHQTIGPITTTLSEGDIVYLSSSLPHQATYSEKGAEIIDLFWPPRTDFIEQTKTVYDRYHEFIPVDAKPVMVHDGETTEPKLRFTEGPSWIDGELFFSNMWFDDGFAAGNPAKSNLIRINKDGTLSVISSGMQTNGTMPLGNGNLAVCDMFGHRLLEMNREGKIIRVLAEKVNGKRIDGPNDLVIDARGGIYISDPQFLPGVDKVQPGKQIYYRSPDGTMKVVLNVGEMGQPNGVLLSPDGKSIYIANTRNLPFGYWQVKGDVNPDGTISNLHAWAKVNVPPSSRQQTGDQKIWYSGSDGMTIDTEGNVYIATRVGLQIFTPDGDYIGNIYTEVPPINAVFGGPNMDEIYMTCATQIWKIKTNKKGLQYPLVSQ